MTLADAVELRLGLTARMKEPRLQRHWPRLEGNAILTELSTVAELVYVDHGLCVFTTLRGDGSV